MASAYPLTDLPVDGYVRVSRVGDRSGDSYISPDVQRERIERLARDRGLELVMHEPDENESGGTMDRPTFNTIMRRIRDGESGGIIVYTLDRFARNLVGGYTLLTEIAERGAVFASATEPQFDFTTSSGRLMLQMHLMMAEYFRERQKETWAASVQSAVDRGIHVAGYGAFGYDRIDRRFVPNEEAPFVVEAFDRRAAGEPLETIAVWLNEHAGPQRHTRRGEPVFRAWTGASVGRLLRRRVYLGEAFSGAVRNPDGHEPLVTRDLFDAAQRPVQTWTNIQRHDDTPDHVLGGLVRCAGCRYTMSVRRNVARGRVRYFHACRKHRASGTCQHPAIIDAERLEDYIEQLVCDELDRRAHEYRGHEDDSAIAAARARRDQARADLDAMRNDTAARRRLGARWLEWVEPYVAAAEDAEREVARLTSESRAGVRGLTADAYRSMRRPDRRAALAAMIDVVFVRRGPGGPTRGPRSLPIDAERVRILWRGEGPEDLPARSRFDGGGIRPWRGFAEDEAQSAMAAG